MKHGQSLDLSRCPHCNIAKPNMIRAGGTTTRNDRNENPRDWVKYECATCGGVVMAVAPSSQSHNVQHEITQFWPQAQQVHETVPERAKAFLEQAIASIHAPAGAVMLTASAVDAMLKEKGLIKGNLNGRINDAAAQHLITPEMAAWAHEIRLDANDQRHADETADLPDEEAATKVIEFATALAQFLFVLPARVARGRAKK